MTPKQEAIERAQNIFTLFDVNGNGHLDPEDFTLMADRVVDAATESGEGDRSALAAALYRYGRTILAELDADHDGTVSREEFTACVLSPHLFADTMAEFADSLARLADPDGDGLIERPYFMTVVGAIGFDRPSLEAYFAALSAGSDQVRATDLAAAIKDDFDPDKGGVAGDHLVPDASG